jgi:hypothetical protein
MSWPLMLAALGQRDAQRLAGENRIVEEQLVEIAHPVEQQRVRMIARFISRYWP